MKNNKYIENFNLIKEQFEIEGYSSKKCVLSFIKLNILAFISSIPLAAICIVLFFLIKRSGTMKISISVIILLWVVTLVSIFVHEFLHGVAWSFYCKKGWQSIHIGVVWKKLTPYCHCMEPLKFKQYIFGSLMPLIVLGLGMFLLSLLTSNLFWLLLSIINIVFAGGDIASTIILIRHKNDLIVDDPSECGFWAFSKNV